MRILSQDGKIDVNYDLIALVVNYKCKDGNGWFEIDMYSGSLSAKNVRMANGYKDGLTLDRIDVNGNYEPNNCQWATNKEQQNNKRNNHLLEHNGEIHTITEWSEITGIKKTTIERRINKYGWSIEKSLTKKPRHDK